MRIIRLFALLLVVIIVFIATPTYTLEPLAALMPTDFMADSPLFTAFQRWVAVDLSRFALLLTSCAGLTFGLLTAPWPVDRATRLPAAQSASPQVPLANRRARRLGLGRRLFGTFLLLLAGAATVVLKLNPTSLHALPGIQGIAVLHGLWVLSIALFLAAAALFTNHKAQTAGNQHTIAARSGADPRVPVGWSTLFTMLFFAMLLYGWRLTTLPLHIDTATVQIGLLAHRLLSDSTISFFAPVAEVVTADPQLFMLALTPTALFTWLTRDILIGTRLAGLTAALLCILGIWLVSVELFARRVDPIDADMPIEDNGQSVAVLATMFFLTNMALFIVSRTPITLMATAWGLLGGWAFLRGLRRQDRLALGLGGLLTGMAVVVHSGGIIFGITNLLWWLGFGAAQLGLLPHRMATGTRSAPTGESRSGESLGSVTVGNFLLWLYGLLLVLMPFLPELVAVRWAFVEIPIALNRSLLTLFSSFAPLISAYPAPLFNLILLPLMPLAIGALLFNLDRRQGWLITSWLISALGVALLLRPETDQWARFLPLIPAVAVALAFTLDRLRVTLLQVGGRWLQQFITILLLGLVLWSAFSNGLTYYTYAIQQSDDSSMLGQIIRARAQNAPMVVVQRATATPSLTADDPQLRFLTNDGGDMIAKRLQFTAEIPTALPPGTLFIVPSNETFWLPTIEAIYPGGTYDVERDHYVNPRFYLYTIP